MLKTLEMIVDFRRKKQNNLRPIELVVTFLALRMS